MTTPIFAYRKYMLQPTLALRREWCANFLEELDAFMIGQRGVDGSMQFPTKELHAEAIAALAEYDRQFMASPAGVSADSAPMFARVAMINGRRLP
jgi:hypothetical protein